MWRGEKKMRDDGGKIRESGQKSGNLGKSKKVCESKKGT
jgi:hypothetical protein